MNPLTARVNFFDFNFCHLIYPNENSEISPVNSHSTVGPGHHRLMSAYQSAIESQISDIETNIKQIMYEINQQKNSIVEKQEQKASLQRTRESLEQTFISTNFKTAEARRRKAEINNQDVQKIQTKFEQLTNEINNLYKEIDSNSNQICDYQMQLEKLKPNQKFFYYQLVKVAKKEVLNEILSSFPDSVNNLDAAAVEAFFEKLELTEKLNEFKSLILKNIDELNSIPRKMQEYRTERTNAKADRKKREFEDKMVNLSNEAIILRNANREIIREIAKISLRLKKPWDEQLGITNRVAIIRWREEPV